MTPMIMERLGRPVLSTLDLPHIDDRSRRQQVVHALREAIASGQLKPGDRLVETEISQQMGVSRAPVREALRQLEQEGLVISYPYRGTEVLGVSAEEVEEILVPIRLTLERYAFRRALPQLKGDDLTELERLVEAMRQAAAAGDIAQLADADLRFHELVLDRSGELHCLQIWRTVSPRVRIAFIKAAPVHASMLDVAEEHDELLSALRSGDEEKMLTVLEAHIIESVYFTRDLPAADGDAS